MVRVEGDNLSALANAYHMLSTLGKLLLLDQFLFGLLDARLHVLESRIVPREGIWQLEGRDIRHPQKSPSLRQVP